MYSPQLLPTTYQAEFVRVTNLSINYDNQQVLSNLVFLNGFSYSRLRSHRHLNSWQFDNCAIGQRRDF